MYTSFVMPFFPITVAIGKPIIVVMPLLGSVPLATTNQNLRMYQGQAFAFTITVTDNGSPVDLTGCTINWVMQPSVNSQTATVSKSTNNGIVITDPHNGAFQVTIVPSDTSGKPPYSYFHEAQVTDVSGNPYPVTVGTLNLLYNASTL